MVDRADPDFPGAFGRIGNFRQQLDPGSVYLQPFLKRALLDCIQMPGFPSAIRVFALTHSRRNVEAMPQR